MSDTKPRFSFEISEEQNKRALKIFSEYGMRKAVMSRILDKVMDMIEAHGYMVVGLILDKDTQIRKIVPSLAKADKKAK